MDEGMNGGIWQNGECQYNHQEERIESGDMAINDLWWRQIIVYLPGQRGQLFKTSVYHQNSGQEGFWLEHMMGNIEANDSKVIRIIANQLWCMEHVLQLAHSEVEMDCGG